MKFPKHYLAAVSAFIIWGFMSFGLKPLSGYASLDILFYRIFLCVVLMLTINLGFRRQTLLETKKSFMAMPFAKRKNLIILTVLSAMLLTANWFFFIYVMNHISVKTASFAYMVCPIITTVFAYFILKEKLTKMQWAAVALSLFSCALLSFGHLMDIFYSLIIASTYALYLIIQKKINSIDKFLLLSVQMIITAVILLPFYPAYSHEVPVAPSFYVYILIIAVMFTIVPLFLNLYSLKRISSSTVGILIYINPLINFFLAQFYYKETISLFQILAYSLIVVSIAVFNAGNFLKPKTAA
jgi:chloramphenicol-sensitive protein RarD